MLVSRAAGKFTTVSTILLFKLMHYSEEKIRRLTVNIYMDFLPQFDRVIMDRPMILQGLHQICTTLPDRKILTWEFFLYRFDALYLESQLALENRGELFMHNQISGKFIWT